MQPEAHFAGRSLHIQFVAQSPIHACSVQFTGSFSGNFSNKFSNRSSKHGGTSRAPSQTKTLISWRRDREHSLGQAFALNGNGG
jgi:hypothetical protein